MPNTFVYRCAKCYAVHDDRLPCSSVTTEQRLTRAGCDSLSHLGPIQVWEGQDNTGYYCQACGRTWYNSGVLKNPPQIVKLDGA